MEIEGPSEKDLGIEIEKNPVEEIGDFLHSFDSIEEGSLVDDAMKVFFENPDAIKDSCSKEELDGLVEIIGEFGKLKKETEVKAKEIDQKLREEWKVNQDDEQLLELIRKLNAILLGNSKELGSYVVDLILEKAGLMAGGKQDRNILADAQKNLMEARYFWDVQNGKKTERESQSIKILGFEKFDTEQKSGNEMVEDLLRKFGFGKLMDKYVAEIVLGESKEWPKEYGISGKYGGLYDSSPERGKIVLTGDDKAHWIMLLAHEFGHAIDPVAFDNYLLSIPITEQLSLYKSFVAIRKEHPKNITDYVAAIKNPNDQVQEEFKRREDWAESMRLFMTGDLDRVSPARYNFWLRWFGLHEPGFTLEKIRNIKISLQDGRL